MRKFLTLMALAVIALTANAKDFTDQMAITIDGKSFDPTENVISVEEVENSDGLYNITLKDFTFASVMNIGDISIENVKGNDDSDGYTWFKETTSVTDVSLGGANVPVTITINEGSRIKDDKLYLNITIQAEILGMPLTITAIFGDDNFPKNYTDSLFIYLWDQIISEQEATIAVTEQIDGKYTMTLKNFEVLGLGKVGTIEMENIDAVDEDGVIKMSTKQTVTIQQGDPVDETDPWNMAGEEVDIDMTAEMTDDKLTAVITISYEVLGYPMDIEVYFGKDKEDDDDSGDSPTGISSVTTTTDSGVEAIYDLSGRKLNEMQKGINIVRKADGTTVKVLKK